MSFDTSLIYSHEGFCPICEQKRTFSARYGWFRDHLICEACHSIPRERAAALMLSRLRPNWRDLEIHECAPEPRGFSVNLRQHCTAYVASNFFPDLPLGMVHLGHRNENLEAQTFADASFDIVVALDVLEHVNRPDDAVAEIARTLRPGGLFLFSTPTYKGKVSSERRALRRPDGTVEHLAEPEYHGNPINAEGSPVTFHYGYDLARAVFGWSMLDVEVVRFHNHHYGIIGEFTELYAAIKTRPVDTLIHDLSDPAENFVENNQMTQIVRAVRRVMDTTQTLSDVSRAIHLEDGIFQFIWSNPVFPSKDDAVRYYFEDGAISARRVRDIIDCWLPQRHAPMSVLEFASGYGAVTRHAKDCLAPHNLFSSDIHPQANSFIQQEMGVATIASARVPEKFDPGRTFDVIFVLSFFSHMPRATWGRWLRRLYDALDPGGLMIFTTHGLESMKYFPASSFDESGFWFEASSEQTDLDVADYGQTITSKDFVDAQIALLPGADFVRYEAAAWWGHQDLYVLRKTDDA